MKPRPSRLKKATAISALIGSGLLLGLFMRKRKRRHLPKPEERTRPDPVDEASRQSFPASDAPGWSPTQAK